MGERQRVLESEVKRLTTELTALTSQYVLALSDNQDAKAQLMNTAGYKLEHERCAQICLDIERLAGISLKPAKNNEEAKRNFRAKAMMETARQIYNHIRKTDPAKVQDSAA